MPIEGVFQPGRARLHDLYLSPVKLGNDVVRRGLIQHELDLVGSGLLVLYAVVWGVIVYRVFDAKSRG